MLRLPSRSLLIDLCLPQGDEIFADRLFIIEAQVLGVCADESLIKDAAWKLIKLLRLNSLEHARIDFCNVRDLIERETFPFALCTELVTESSHHGPQRAE
jgi:hypothetical protein